MGIDEDGFFYPYKMSKNQGLLLMPIRQEHLWIKYFDDVDLDLKSIDIVGNLREHRSSSIM